MIKRMLSLLLILLMAASAALAQNGTIATYTLPDGAEIKTVQDADEWHAPKGLESMYALMLQATANQGDVYLARMPKGRALASISCTPMREMKTAEDLLALWPDIAAAIEAQGVTVDKSADCARIVSRYGRDVLHIQTSILTADGLELHAEGLAFYREMELMEVWAVYPEREESNLFSNDVKALGQFVNSLAFDDPMSMETVPYADPDGRYTLEVLADAPVVHADMPQEEVAAIRQKYIEANRPGAERVFDVLMEDVKGDRVLLILSPDMKGIALVFANRNESFVGFTAREFKLIEPALTQSLNDRFGRATFLDSTTTTQISGVEHAWLGYWLESGECEMQLDILACVPKDDWLCEIDLFVADGDATTRSLLYSLISQTLTYTLD